MHERLLTHVLTNTKCMQKTSKAIIYLGVDIGKTSHVWTLVDQSGNILEEGTGKTNRHGSTRSRRDSSKGSKHFSSAVKRREAITSILQSHFPRITNGEAFDPTKVDLKTRHKSLTL